MGASRPCRPGRPYVTGKLVYMDMFHCQNLFLVSSLHQHPGTFPFHRVFRAIIYNTLSLPASLLLHQSLESLYPSPTKYQILTQFAHARHLFLALFSPFHLHLFNNVRSSNHGPWWLQQSWSWGLQPLPLLLRCQV